MGYKQTKKRNPAKKTDKCRRCKKLGHWEADCYVNLSGRRRTGRR